MKKMRPDFLARRILSTMRPALLGLLLSGGGSAAQPPLSQSPQGMFVPPLHPAGATLATQDLAPGVYALVSSKVPVDNSGFVVGENGVLVIDAHINGAMARQIQGAVRRVTPKPILYLINTNYHGDHTFGNYAFPVETRIVAHRKTAELMKDFEREKEFLLAAVNGDRAVFADVRPRLPDVVFDDYLRLDLGGRTVELYHFGFGNTPGDTVVYVPEAKAAWTGNLILGEGTLPFLLEGHAEEFLLTIARLAETLDVRTIVPGHGRLTTGAILSRYMDYLNDLMLTVRGAVTSGRSLEETLSAAPLPARYVPSGGPTTAADPQQQQMLQQGQALLQALHRRNVWMVYQDLASRRPSSGC